MGGYFQNYLNGLFLQISPYYFLDLLAIEYSNNLWKLLLNIDWFLKKLSKFFLQKILNKILYFYILFFLFLYICTHLFQFLSFTPTHLVLSLYPDTYANWMLLQNFIWLFFFLYFVHTHTHAKFLSWCR